TSAGKLASSVSTVSPLRIAEFTTQARFTTAERADGSSKEVGCLCWRTAIPSSAGKLHISKRAWPASGEVNPKRSSSAS
ncbi:hypothetical protein, partial [Winogradskyella poriferorum]|uniref:hypothetical protein n=1 Tax=Winogradskyella poriferorum TaxID=307627 RepID=UPI003D65B1BD